MSDDEDSTESNEGAFSEDGGADLDKDLMIIIIADEAKLIPELKSKLKKQRVGLWHIQAHNKLAVIVLYNPW